MGWSSRWVFFACHALHRGSILITCENRGAWQRSTDEHERAGASVHTHHAQSGSLLPPSHQFVTQGLRVRPTRQRFQGEHHARNPGNQMHGYLKARAARKIRV